ncbi:MAG: pantoate--beta-alanine ligase [Candidatus Loosdrechtia sp.]|uniref:4-phosphopantoate--beta-alanine ligase n=1 Tax=Candidatus Loosdrechtia sp. TaxID=3101272 RepID=UPI003A6B02BE|nr:MAG: pantoate--beta-alanine ligase [Candidatus Jettenia sp. AMX2]
MQIITSIKDIKQRIKTIKGDQLTIGFVPTMGALHEGHMSLVRNAKKENDTVIVSIFVNPFQFGKNEDFKQYPRTFERDCELLSKEGADYIFSPDITEMYPEGFSTLIILSQLEDKLCGRSRPGHFRSVAVVVLKLLHLIKPDLAYFGQKDFQQTVIIKKMIQDLNLDIAVKILPTVRDEKGLALSSRNVYLTETEKKEALCLYKSLLKAQSMVHSGITDTKIIIREIENSINNHNLVTIDYISIIDPETLESVTTVRNGDVIAIAVKVGKTRLIDNAIFNYP